MLDWERQEKEETTFADFEDDFGERSGIFTNKLEQESVNWRKKGY